MKQSLCLLCSQLLNSATNLKYNFPCKEREREGEKKVFSSCPSLKDSYKIDASVISQQG